MTAAPIAPRLTRGAMRLSTDRDRDDERAIAVLHAAFDAGFTLIDTADAYCHDASETGHNERLIRRALESWPGDRSAIVVTTKGGLTRPNGLWIADGRAKQLARACEASRLALGLDRLPLYQLHAPDSRVPLATSVRALEALRRDGVIEAIGLCNVNVAQIEEARAIAEIASIQVELSLWRDEAILNGVLEYCIAHNLALLAHRPLGGVGTQRQIAANPVLSALARRYDATPFEIALSWVNSISPIVTALPGATRVETVRSIARAASRALTDADRAVLEDAFAAPRARAFRRRPPPRATTVGRGEIAMILGLPGAGKSTLARTFVDRGYARLNRDEIGGSLRELLPALDRLVAADRRHVILDNTYLTRKSRALVLQAAARHRLAVRCIWLTTGVDDAQVNAVSRIVATYGRLLSPDEMRNARRRDVSAFPPGVLFRSQRELEPPEASEGFVSIERLPFVRVRDPAFVNRAVIVWSDGILASSRAGHRSASSPDDVQIDQGRAETLRRYAADGWRVLALSWQPEIAARTREAASVEATFAKVRELMGVAIEFEYCPHPAGPPVCWCRKPLPGLGVELVHRHKLDAASCLYVGEGPHDAAFARKLEFQFRNPGEFFDATWPDVGL